MSFLAGFLLFMTPLFSQSRHGEINYDCSSCHQSTTWEVDKVKMEFDHDKTDFKLVGQHKIVDCISCHTDLVFADTPADCFSCHKDIHQNTVGFNCASCHTPESWIVKDIIGIHQVSRFPLLGAHQNADCIQCHQGFDNLNFEPLGVSCIDCHRQDFLATIAPNHTAAGFSTDCNECHSVTEFNWSARNFNHDFFPLSGGHKIANCFDCHQQGGNFTGLSTDCYSCHREDYESVQDPNHIAANFPTNCIVCHSINGWSPSTFDHNLTQFPLTGAHINIDCSSCHESGFSGTSTVCVDCHNNDYNQSVNPSHTALAIPTDCQTCHSTNPGWEPASFAIHNNYYELIGAHASIADNCISCHNGDYNNTPNTCFGCHESDYNATTNPPHAQSGFGTDCESCHNPNAWQPATFDHDGQYFPIYSGRHQGEWNACSDCHTNPQNFSVFSCIDCHEHNQPDMDQRHEGVSGYVYASEACYACHPDGTELNAFNHNASAFPLTGAHTTLNCQQCHQTGYLNTPTECSTCHLDHYNSAVNPNHQALSISTDCSSCHTSNPDWQPALFTEHNNYFQLVGRHAEIANDCFSCHNGNYNTTPDQCIGCHETSYNNAANPNHAAAGIPVTCENCHTSTAWIPSSFNHTTTGFELTGQHAAIECSSCHQGTTTGLSNLCFSCHENNYNSAPEHLLQNYPTTCEVCHNSSAWNQVNFNHNNTNFPLTGAHISTDCSACHQSGYTGTTTICNDCHQAAYAGSTNPSHTALALSTDCQTCHTTNPGWEPATFPVHNNFYALVGAHSVIANQCFTCHEGNYNSTPNTCFGCHDNDYNNTTNPNHQAAGFPTACENCHTQNAWSPATFDHDNLYFPIYSGRHDGKWNNCSDCHPDPNNFNVFTCTTACHPQGEMNIEHQGVSGYVYQSSACLSCHPDGEDKFKLRMLQIK